MNKQKSTQEGTQEEEECNEHSIVVETRLMNLLQEAARVKVPSPSKTHKHMLQSLAKDELLSETEMAHCWALMPIVYAVCHLPNQGKFLSLDFLCAVNGWLLLGLQRECHAFVSVLVSQLRFCLSQVPLSLLRMSHIPTTVKSMLDSSIHRESALVLVYKWLGPVSTESVSTSTGSLPSQAASQSSLSPNQRPTSTQGSTRKRPKRRKTNTVKKET